MMQHKTFVFIGEEVQTRIEKPHEFIPNYFFKKADREQVETIKRKLDSYIKLFYPYNPKECDVTEFTRLKGKMIQKKLSEHWNYYIIEHSKLTTINEFYIAAYLIENDLNFVLEFAKPARGKKYIPVSHGLLTPTFFLNPIEKIRKVKITKEYLYELEKTFYSVTEFMSTLTNVKFFVWKALINFKALKKITDQSPLKIVGIFAILELLLTHEGHSKEESITRQLKKKIILLNNRFPKPIEYKTFFPKLGDMSEEKILTKLYEYRSCIAHGGVIDFKSKFNQFVDRDCIQRFLYYLLKKVLLQAIIEPQLIKDLKEC